MEMFIEKVRNHPCLWDTESVAYRDAATKEVAWKLVAKACGIATAAEAKNQWKRLRDSHREAMRRRKAANAAQAQSIGPWKYEKLMEFILPQNREAYVSLCNESYLENPLACLTTEECESNGDNSTLGVEREIKRERDDLKRQIFENNRPRRDALSDLFSSMCEKTRELPKYLQLRVQREIFDAVTRAEEEALSYDNQAANTTYFNTSAEKYGQMDVCQLAETKYRYAESPSTSVINPETAEQNNQ